MNKVQQIIDAMIKSGGNVIDDHNGKSFTYKWFGMFTGSNGAEHVFPIVEDYFCINPLKLDEQDVVHLERYSVGSLVDGRGVTVVEAAAKYNQSMPGRITHVFEITGENQAALNLLEVQ